MSIETERAAAVNKARLIREGELYRVSLAHSKAVLDQALRPEALLHGALEHAVGVAQSRFGGLLQPGGLSGLNFKALMPYALTVGSFIARRRLVKPALAVGAAVALGVTWLMRHRRDPYDQL